MDDEIEGRLYMFGKSLLAMANSNIEGGHESARWPWQTMAEELLSVHSDILAANEERARVIRSAA